LLILFPHSIPSLRGERIKNFVQSLNKYALISIIQKKQFIVSHLRDQGKGFAKLSKKNV
jgi:hypothetical protein